MKIVAHLSLIWIFLLSLTLPASASSIQGDWSDLEFKLQLEKVLTEQVRNMIEATVPKTHYYFSLSVTIAPPSKPAPVAVEQKSEFLPLVSEEEIKELQKNTDQIYLDKIGGVWTRLPAQTKQTEAAPTIANRTIQKIDAILALDESINPDQLRPVKAMVESLLKTYSKTVSFKIQKEKVYTEPKKVDAPIAAPVEKQMEMKDWLQLLKDPVALLIAALMGVFGYITVNQKRVAVEKEKASAMAAAASNGQKTDAGPQASAQSHAPAGASAAGENTSARSSDRPHSENIESELNFLQVKITSILDEHPNDIKLLLKEWISQETPEAIAGLTLLSQSVPLAKLQKMISLLSSDEKESWKKKISSDLDVSQMALGVHYLQAGISKHFLSEADAFDPELKELLAVLTPRDAVELVRSSPHLSAFLFNQLSTLQLSRVFSLLSQEELSLALRESVAFNDKQNVSMATEVKAGVAAIQSRNKQVVSPFVERSFELIKQVSASKEISIFEAIASIGHDEALSRLSILCFPSDLVCDLPPAFLQMALSKLSMQKKTEVILSLEEDRRGKLLATFGESGKLREMIDIEVQTMASNELKMRSIEKSKETIWNDFLKVVRELYRNQEDEPIEIEDLRKNWIKTLLEQAAQKKNSNEKVA